MPIRLIIELVAAFAIIVGGLVYHKHVENLGEAKILALDKKLSDEVDANNKSASDLAQAQSDHIGVVYEKAVAIPAIGDVGLVCQSPHRSQASAVADYRPENPGAAKRMPEGGFDPSGGILTLLRDSDAQINALIDEVIVLDNYIKAEE